MMPMNEREGHLVYLGNYLVLCNNSKKGDLGIE